MKKLLIICGTGIATSTVVKGKVMEWLKENNLDNEVQLFQSKVSDEINSLDNYDVVVSTTIVPDHLQDKVINGVPLLTGVGKDEFFAELKKQLTE